MVVNRAALWGLMITCCLVAVPVAVRHKLQDANGRGETAKALVDGVMTGLGVGIGAATGIFLAAGLVALLDA